LFLGWAPPKQKRLERLQIRETPIWRLPPARNGRSGETPNQKRMRTMGLDNGENIKITMVRGEGIRGDEMRTEKEKKERVVGGGPTRDAGTVQALRSQGLQQHYIL
jgi:hypothetical protein